MKKVLKTASKKAGIYARNFVCNKEGNVLTDNLGNIIIGALVIGLIVGLVNGWLPDLAEEVFDYVKDTILP